MSASPAPIFIHVDFDGLWTLPDCYGYEEGDDFRDDPVYSIAGERLLALFGELGVRATFFIVGRDLELEAKRDRVRGIAAFGHALANHSYSHDLALERRSGDEISEEITAASDAIERVSGTRPIGFRAPGYGAGPRVLEACLRSGLRYDGSRFPSRWGGLLRFLAGRLRVRTRAEIGAAVAGSGGAAGTKADVQARPSHPPLNAADLALQYGGGEREVKSLELSYWPDAEAAQRLLRLPVAVSPRLRLPLQASLGMLLGERRAVDGLLRLHRRGMPVTFLVHGMDALGIDDLRGRLPRALATSRAFQFTAEYKLGFLQAAVKALAAVGPVLLTEQWIADRTPGAIKYQDS